jgi:hypothetical protein
MSHEDFLERLNKQIGFYYQILKESWTETAVLHKLKEKERTRHQRYHEEVDQFLGLSN